MRDTHFTKFNNKHEKHKLHFVRIFAESTNYILRGIEKPNCISDFVSIPKHLFTILYQC